MVLNLHPILVEHLLCLAPFLWDKVILTTLIQTWALINLEEGLHSMLSSHHHTNHILVVLWQP
jgi:hypothetical protein